MKDYDAIVSLWSRAGLPFKPEGRDSKECVEKQIAVNPDFVLGAFSDGHLIGTIVLSSDIRKGWINRLAVDPDYRCRGVATALIEESEKTLRKHGLKIFCSLVEDSNEPSKTLFRKCGYSEHRDITYFSKRDNDTI
jgi:ribosomal protein S18 acetylase RimI-like enzyme